MIEVLVVAVVIGGIVARLRWLRREDRELSIAPSAPCECAPLSPEEYVLAEADRIVLAAFLDFEIERTLEEGL